MKLPNVILAVLGLHFVVIAALILPACQTSESLPRGNDPIPENISVLGLEDEEIEEPMRPNTIAGSTVEQPDTSKVDSAFNAGIPTDGSTSTREAPARPSWNVGAEDKDYYNVEVLDDPDKYKYSASVPTVTAPAPSTVTPEKTTRSYTVKSGDSLWKISKKNGVSLNALLSANGLNKNSVIRPGQELVIPGSSASATTYSSPSTTSTPATASGNTYTVQRGDSLSKIASRNGTSVSALKSVNGLSSDMIRVGQVLSLPDGSTPTPVRTSSSSSGPKPKFTSKDGLIHVVRRGESIGAIARDYGVDWREVMRLNGITDARKVQVGQQLLIKRGVQKPTRPSEVDRMTPDKGAVPLGGSRVEEVKADAPSFIDLDDIPTVPVDN